MAGPVAEHAAGALIWCPFPDADAAASVARTLLDERLVACANLVPGVHALFAWRGERGEAHETGALFKTAAAHLDTVMRRLAELHPYDAPAITGWTVRADPGTLAWLNEETGAATGDA